MASSLWPPLKEATDADLLKLKLSVDAININIRTGDGAIYLLIEHPPNSPLKPGEIDTRKPFIHRAVLIDGGLSGGRLALEEVVKNRLPKLYSWDKTQGGRTNLPYPAFDSIVVTHWDRDHFRGLVGFIYTEVAVNADPNNPGLYLCNYMKYADAAPGAERGLRAKTTFYAPYWKGGPGFPRSSTFSAANANNAGGDTYLHWQCATKAESKGKGKGAVKERVWVKNICKLKTGLTNILGCNLFTGKKPTYDEAMGMKSPQHLAVWHSTGKIEVDHPINVKSDAAWPVLCIVASASVDGGGIPRNECCGGSKMDFKGEVDKIQKYLEKKDNLGDDAEPEDELEDGLVEKYYPKNLTTGPVTSTAVHGIDLDNDSTPDSNAMKSPTASRENTTFKFTPVQHVVDTPLPKSSPPSKSDWTNMHSIISMVIWTTGQLSSYQGGDANWEGEMNVVAWCQQALNPFKCVRNVKLSHHGSADSTPYELIRCFRPRNIIISADTNASYGHPRWEVLLYLDLWMQFTNKKRISINLGNYVNTKNIVRATSYPNYIAFDPNGKKKSGYVHDIPRLNFNAFLPSKSQDILDYQNMMKLLIAEVYKGIDDPYIKAVQGFMADKENRRRYMYKLVFEAWKRLSVVGYQAAVQYDNSGVQVDGFADIPAGDGEEILYIKSHCRPNSSQLRSKADGYFDGASYAVKRKTTTDHLNRWAKALPSAEFKFKNVFSTNQVVSKSGKRKSNTSSAKIESMQNDAKARAAKKRASDVGNVPIPVPSPGTQHLTYGKYQDVTFEPQASASRASKTAPTESALRANTTSETGISLPANMTSYIGVDSTADNWLDVQLTYQVSSDGPDGEFDEMASFLLQLEQPMLEVDGTPDVDDNFPLSITDPLRIWLLQALQANPSPDQASVSVKLLQGSTSMDAKVISFKIDVPAKDTKPALIFSTTALQGNFSDRGLPSLENRPPTIPESGFEGVHSFLCLGLVNNSTTWSIQDVFLQSNIDISDSVEGYGAVLAVVFQKFQALQDLKLELERGMIWFLPSESYRTVQRLEWTLGAGAAGSLEEWCTELMPNVSIQNPTIVSRRECTKADVGDTTELSFEHELLFMFGITSENPSYVVTCGLDLNLKDGSEMLTAIIRVDPMTQDTRVNLEDFVGWLVPSVDISGIADIIPFIENVGVRSVELDINIAGKISISQITVMAEYSWQLTGSDGNEKPVPLLLTYVWTKDRAQPHSVNLKSWLQPDILQWFTPQIMPKYEDLYYIRPSSVPTNELNLKDLMPGDYHLPAELSLDISNLALEFKDTTVTIAGRLQKANDTETFGILLEEVDITASFMWGDKGNTKKNRDPNSFEISLQTTILLKPSSERVSIIATSEDENNEDGGFGESDGPLVDGKIPEEMAIVMCEVTLQKSGNQWNFQLIGDVTDLTLAHLGVFFPPDDADIMIDLLGHIGIQSLDIEYNYNSGMQTGSTGPSAPNAPKGASVSDFSMSAVLLLDVLELDFTFVRDEDSWSLDAVLRSVDVEEITVGTVLRSLLGEKGQESTVDIPSFVSNINISNAAVKLSVRSINATEGTAMGAVSVCLAIDVPCSDNSILEFAFLQTTNKTGTLRPLAAPAPPNIQNATKRMIKVNLGSLPWNKIPKVPVIDRMKPAFDSLAFYWVLDPTWKDATKLPGLTRQEVERLNELSPILFKDKQKATPDTKPDPNAASAIVLAAGMHFLVPDSVSQGTPRAILDYLFNKPRAPSPMLSQALAVDQSGILIQAVDDTPTGTSNATLEKNMGAFSISNVGLRYQDSELIIYLDIAANLGPIKLALHKFGFGFNLGAISLKDITENQVPSFHLEGMGVEFNKPPISIAGTFLHHETESVETYVGGINLTIQPYSFMAVGGYSEIHNKNTSGNFKSVFFFAKLNGPLIELEFVTIGGICLGFGYNSVIRFPSIQELPQFPFLANSSLPNNDPLAIMTKLSSTDPVVGVVSPKDSSYWLAAGLEAKALEVLDVSAVVILEFNPYVSLGVFAKAIGQMPPTPAPREACFLYVELGVLTTIDLSAGTLRVEAQLSPNSFIIAPSCRLTGGFALCYWFPPSGHAGDFVFSVGGYHNAFKPPAHYPVPPRLGITWNFGIVSVTGEAYWAITPKACMGGGKLKLNYNLGLLHAWLAVTADFLMEYHPFKFIADIGVEVGVHFILEILFISIDISISIRAELTLWGVPFGGEVYVDFWVFGFTIGFGESQRDPAVNLEAFRELLIQVPDSDSATSEGQNAGSVDKLHVLSVESGRYSENAKPDDTTTKQGDVWEVKRGGFVFRVQSRVPLQSIVELEFTNDPVKGPATSTRSDKSFYARPMQLQSQLTSTMTVGITKKEDGEILEFPLVRQVVKQVPLALWGYYDPAKAPGRNKNNIADLLDPKDGTIELMTGASFQCPLPEIAEDHLVPFNALESASQDVFTDADPQQPGGDEHPQLRGDVVFQDGTWRPAQPVVDEEDKAKQWEVVKAAWEAPEIVANEDPSGLPVDILGVAAALWSDAFGWGFGDNETNGLKNEVSLMADGNPIVWKSFEEIYMAAPLVGVTA